MAASKQVWIEFMETINKDKQNEVFEVPSGIEGVVVDIETGKLATEACPKQRLVYMKEEDIPTEECTIFDDNEWGDFFNLFQFEAFSDMFTF